MEDAGSRSPESGTISRRATLAKGAAAGALAWTTPVVLSTSANAGTTCTPKCIPQTQPSGTISGTWDSNSIDFTISVNPFTCPCTARGGGTSPGVVSDISGTLTRTDSPNLGDCTNNNPTLLTGSRTGNQLGFTRTGLLSNNYCYAGSINVTVTCEDRSGDTITSTAAFQVPQFRISLLAVNGNVFANPQTRDLSFGTFGC